MKNPFLCTLMFLVVGFYGCRQLKYQDVRYLEIDYDNMDKSREFWTEEERETYREAERRANIQERKEGSRELKREGRYYTKIQSGSEINISERLFEYIKDNIEAYNEREFLGGIYKDEASIPKYPLAEDLVWAIMHSGPNSASWQDSEYKRICRYADRVKKDWREKGFTLEEADRLVRKFRPELQRMEFNQMYVDTSTIRSLHQIVLYSNVTGPYHAINASRIVPYRQKELRLRCLNYHRSLLGDTRGAKYGYTQYLRFDSIQYIYR
ncbi:MAG: hypothetical protein IJ154_04780 [Bacteroidales bacterium]|nr:hypothetical protein [Bacteroidales bacterium]